MFIQRHAGRSVVDAHMAADWIAVLCAGAHVLVSDLNERALIQAAQKALGIAPIGSNRSLGVHVDGVLPGTRRRRPAAAAQVGGIGVRATEGVRRSWIYQRV